MCKKKPNAFVLMPFESEFSRIYEGLIKPALEEADYDVAKADSFLDQQNILRDIVRGIATADLVVAELTTLNPNVLYELGICHGLQIPTILLVQSMEEVPFDLRAYRIIVYSTRFDQVHKLKQALKEIGLKHKNREITFGSPITDFLPEGCLSARQVSRMYTERSIERLPYEVEDEKGFLDFILDGTKSAEEVNRIMSEITEETLNIGKTMEYHAARIQALAKNPEPGKAAQLHKIATITATDMTLYSEKIENRLPTLENSNDLLIESFSGYVNWIEPKTEEDRIRVVEFRQTIAGLLEAVRTGLQGIRGYRGAISGLKGISREINRASQRLIQTLDGLISIMEKVEAFCSRTLPLIDEKLGKKCEPEGSPGA